MNEAQRHCGFCWVMYGRSSAEHSPLECRRTGGLNVEMSEGLRDSVSIDRRCKVCWRCGITQQICKGVEKEQACQWTEVAAALWLSWFRHESCQDILNGGGFVGENLAEFGRWLGLRAQAKVQGVIVSNGMWLLWTMMQRSDWVGRATINSNAKGDDAGDTEPTRVTITGSRAVGLSVVPTSGSTKGSPTARDDGATKGLGITGVKSILVESEDVIARRHRLIRWLSQRCIYCEVQNAPPSRQKHWHKTCVRSQSLLDGCGYDEVLIFQEQMDANRKGRCYSCKKDIEDECGARDSWEVTCGYADIMLHTVFILYQSGWLKNWLRREGYRVAFGYLQLQLWLNEMSDKGGINRNRVVEAFEAYALEFDRME